MVRILFLTLSFLCMLPAVAGDASSIHPPVPASGDKIAAAEQVFPRIANAGGVFALTAEMPERNVVHKLVIDASGAETTPTGTNRHFEAAARAVNLYALAGVPPEHVRIAVVVHGEATAATLSNEAFREKFGEANPDAVLLADLHRAGVEIHVCGQALMHKGYTPADVHPDVRVALSAMTKLAELQAAGYSLIP